MGGGGYGSGGGRRPVGLRIPIKHIVGKAPGSSKAQNNQFSDVVKKLRLTPKQKNELHREISGRGLDFQEILEIAKDMFKK